MTTIMSIMLVLAIIGLILSIAVTISLYTGSEEED